MSLPSGPIQALPTGLLGLLQLKNRGRYPDVLQGTVQPVLDMLPWWLNGGIIADATDHSTALTSASGVIAGFTTNPVVVPDGEMWYVHYLTIEAQVSVGATELAYLFAPAINYVRVGTPRWAQLAPPITVQGVAGSTMRGAVTSDGGFWAPSGSELGFYVGRVTAAVNLTFAGNFQYTPIPI